MTTIRVKGRMKRIKDVIGAVLLILTAILYMEGHSQAAEAADTAGASTATEVVVDA